MKYFIDGIAYDMPEKCTIGAIIKSKMTENKRGYSLYLEGSEKKPDKMIHDDTSVTFLKSRPLRFYTVPATTGG